MLVFVDSDSGCTSVNVTHSQCIESPLSIVLKMALKAVTTEQISAECEQFCSRHKNGANLVGSILWDDRWTHIVGKEMLHVYEMKNTILGAKPRDTSTCNVSTL